MIAWKALCFVLATIVPLTTCRDCYVSVSRIGERIPSLDTTYCRSNYCVKFDDMVGTTTRTCDREGLCDRIGNRCQMVRNYHYHEEAYACCCSGDLCNSAPSASAKSVFYLLAVGVLVTTITNCFF
ncbi:hypothetical protein QR680_002449 [Steinernema hermaphroditum]|uniref:UPAR/Ly6 domain-containing protein n=1 Tax=Steinernema hermaphroditum TaxID=289476 RepID=A0AA39H2R4_9BILA|nr:hypothetical protein QR680_002449 [Steinernema hermaphroditum]